MPEEKNIEDQTSPGDSKENINAAILPVPTEPENNPNRTR